MSQLDLFILILFGGVMIASGFLLVSSGRLVVTEVRRPGRAPVRKNRFLVIVGSIAVGAVALMGISWVRVRDGLAGQNLGGTDPWTLSISLLLLWGAWTGFHWASSIGRSRWTWRLYVALAVLWVGLAVALL